MHDWTPPETPWGNPEYVQRRAVHHMRLRPFLAWTLTAMLAGLALAALMVVLVKQPASPLPPLARVLAGTLLVIAGVDLSDRFSDWRRSILALVLAHIGLGLLVSPVSVDTLVGLALVVGIGLLLTLGLLVAVPAWLSGWRSYMVAGPATGVILGLFHFGGLPTPSLPAVILGLLLLAHIDRYFSRASRRVRTRDTAIDTAAQVYIGLISAALDAIEYLLGGEAPKVSS